MVSISWPADPVRAALHRATSIKFMPVDKFL